ncbi:MAG: hypothetical protein M3044_11215 [Thermoproteota archaeon]|nr:hypothetical protein [Thermoproteota archaeon]
MGGRSYLGIPKELQSEANKLLKKDLSIVVNEVLLSNQNQEIRSKTEDRFLDKVAKGRDE